MPIKKLYEIMPRRVNNDKEQMAILDKSRLVSQYDKFGYSSRDEISRMAFWTWCLGVKGMSVDQLLAYDNLSSEEKDDLSREFYSDLSEHDFKLFDETRNTKSGKWYGEMCKNAMQKIKDANIKFPTRDALKDGESRSNYNDMKFHFAANLGLYWHRISSSWSDQPGFMESYGGTMQYAKDMNMMQGASAVGRAFHKYLSIRHQAYTKTMAVKSWLPKMGGKTLSEFAEEDTTGYGSMAFGQQRAIEDDRVFGFNGGISYRKGMRFSGLKRSELHAILDGGLKEEPKKADQPDPGTVFKQEANSGFLNLDAAKNAYKKALENKVPDFEINSLEFNFHTKNVDEQSLNREAEKFDKFFGELNKIEQDGLKEDGKRSIVENFTYNGYPIKTYVLKDLGGWRVTEDKMIKLQKAWVMKALSDGYAKDHLVYSRFPFLEKLRNKYSFKVTQEELDKAAKLFDKKFENLRKLQGSEWEKHEETDITGNFILKFDKDDKVGKESDTTVRLIVESMLNRTYTSPEDKIKYEKLFILQTLNDPDSRERLDYEPFPELNMDEINKKVSDGLEYDKKRFGAFADNGRSGLVSKVYRAEAEAEHPEEFDRFKEGKLDVFGMSDEDLDLAEKNFDKIFKDTKLMEQEALQHYGKGDVSGNFLFDGISVKSIVNSHLEGQNVSEDKRVKYEKVFILKALADKNREEYLQYLPFEFNWDGDNVTVFAATDNPEYDLKNVMEKRRKEEMARTEEENNNNRGKNILLEFDRLQLVAARAELEYRKKQGDWRASNSRDRIIEALRYHYSINQIEGKATDDYAYLEGFEFSEQEMNSVNIMVESAIERKKARAEEAMRQEKIREEEEKGEKINADQISVIRNKVIKLQEAGIDLDEFIDSSAYENYKKGLEDYNAEVSPVELALLTLKGDAGEKYLKSVPAKYAGEAENVLNHIELRFKDASENKDKYYNCADEKAQDLAFWFSRHEYSTIAENSLLKMKEVSKKEDKEGKEYTVYELTEDLNDAVLDPDKAAGLDINTLKEAKKLFNDNKDAFSLIFNKMKESVREEYWAGKANAMYFLKDLGSEDHEIEDKEIMKKLNNYRHLMYKLKQQDERICKIGTDRRPVYVEPLEENTDFTSQKVILTESLILDECFRMLEEPAGRVHRNSREYLELMASVTELKENLNKTYEYSNDARINYIKGIEKILMKADVYYKHKAETEIKNDATHDKIAAVERVSNLLKSRYRGVEQENYMDLISKTETLFEETVDPKLKGDKYVFGKAKGKIQFMKEHLKELQDAIDKENPNFIKDRKSLQPEPKTNVAKETAKTTGKATVKEAGRNSI